MSEGTRNLTQEYWRPAQPPRAESRAMQAETVCTNCGSEYAVGARFCHVCGNEREPEMRIAKHVRIAEMLNLEKIWERIDKICDHTGLNMTALILSVIGAICVLGALVVSVRYTANTVLDWQAVQVWRIQWMLGAIVAFVAAILFNRKKTA